MKKIFLRIRNWLASLSFKTGVIMLCCCAVCYLLSFLQALLPVSLVWKGVLWASFFGLAKTFQYSGILILGKEGWQRLKRRFRHRQKEIDLNHNEL